MGIHSNRANRIAALLVLLSAAAALLRRASLARTRPRSTPRSAAPPTFQRDADGSLIEQPRRQTTVDLFSGGGGLYSTARDYLTFSRAIVAGGQLAGRRILSAESVEAMGRNQIGEMTIGPFTSLVPQLMVPRVELAVPTNSGSDSP